MVGFIETTSKLLIKIEVLVSLVPERAWSEVFVGETTASKVGASGASVSNIIVVAIDALSFPTASRKVMEIVLISSAR